MPGLRRSARVAAQADESVAVSPPSKKQKPAVAKAVKAKPTKGEDSVVEKGEKESGLELELKAASKVEPKVETKVEPKVEPKADLESKPKTEALAELEEGDSLPETLTLQDDNGKEVNLFQLTTGAGASHRIVVLFSYPKASTPGCTRQAQGYRDNYDALSTKAFVFGISADSIAAQKKFSEKHGFQYPLLSDPKRELIGLLGGKKTAASGVTRSHWVFVDGVLKHKHVGISPEKSVTLGKEEVDALYAGF